MADAQGPQFTERNALQLVFNAFAGAGQMDGKSFAKMCKECGLLNRDFTSTDVDLLFAKIKTGRTIGFTAFEDEALPGIANKLNVYRGAVAERIIKSGGPSYSNGTTKADFVKFHDDKSTYTGIYLNGGPSTTGDGPVQLQNLMDRSPADARGVKMASFRSLRPTAADSLRESSELRRAGSRRVLGEQYAYETSPTLHRVGSSKRNLVTNSNEPTPKKQLFTDAGGGDEPRPITSGLNRASSSKRILAGMGRTGSSRNMGAAMRPAFDSMPNNISRDSVMAPTSNAQLEMVFAQFCGPQGMDGRTFAKICQDAKVVKGTVDADMAFTYVKSKGSNKIQEPQFVRAVAHLAARIGQDFELAKKKIVGAGGPQYTATVAEYNRFHDDKSTYMGVHLHGGPSTWGDGPITLSNQLDRSPADVRGVKY